jgi:hypothetical protein
MKTTINKILVSIFLIYGLNVSAQDPNLNFFDSSGMINYSEMLTNDLGYLLTHMDNRADDVVWAHITYSIIDMRDNINTQLAFPTGQDANFKNLFRLIAEAIVDKTPVYYPNDAELTPVFDTVNLVPHNKLSDVFFIETFVGGAQYIDPLFEIDSVSNTASLNNRIYDRFAKGINKFLIQQVYYFDTHLSRMHSKIIGIAPLMVMEDVVAPIFPSFDDEAGTNDDAANMQQLKNTLRESIVCWLLYDDLQAHFSKQPVFPENNMAQRISYHEFFSKKMYSSYLIGDNNLIKKLYSNTSTLSSAELSAEITNIERKLIEIESQLWGK